MMAYQDHPMVEPGPPLAVALDDDDFEDPGRARRSPTIDDDPRFE